LYPKWTAPYRCDDAFTLYAKPWDVMKVRMLRVEAAMSCRSDLTLDRFDKSTTCASQNS
jgi:hypothetical protein